MLLLMLLLLLHEVLRPVTCEICVYKCLFGGFIQALTMYIIQRTMYNVEADLWVGKFPCSLLMGNSQRKFVGCCKIRSGDKVTDWRARFSLFPYFDALLAL